MRGVVLALVVSSTACRPAASTAPAPVDDAALQTVSWSEVRAELDAAICIRRYPDEAGGSYEVPIQGMREECELPRPATALARAATTAFTQANEVTMAYPEESLRAQELVRSEHDPQARIAAVRATLLSERVLAVLMRRLAPALAHEGLRCLDCPFVSSVTPRAIVWAELAPYLAAYVWPDPVVTPRSADGKKTGEPSYSMHMCVGINGIQRMSAVDEDLRFAALLAAFHTEALFERAPQIFAEVRAEPAYSALVDDTARTEHLRAHVGPRVAADPQVRAGICATLSRYAADTPIRVTDCAAAVSPRSTAD